MSPRRTGGGPLPAPSNPEHLAVAIHLFPCGHGDTILIEYGDNRWSLIDCFLPKKDGTRDRFFDFVANRAKIRRLDFIFQTHPDYDHYHGMIDVIQHFTTGGRSVGWYLDTGLNARDVRAAFRHRVAAREYEELQNYVRGLHRSNVLVVGSLSASLPPLSPRGMAGAIDFLPVGPDAVSQREHLAREIQKQARNPGAAIDVNPLSLVIALECNMGGQRFAALLAADTDEKGTDRALDLWARRAREGRRAEAFDVVKLSHHGSLASHNDRLCVEPGRERAPGLAAICCGTRAALPDREVIRRFQTAGWKVFATMTRRTPARVARRPHRDLPMELSDRSRFTVRMPNLHHVQIRWSPKSGVSAIPRSAAIRKRDLDQYETANE